MICRDCRNQHKGKPDGCPDCGCQHKGELLKPEARREPEPILVGWECRTCGVLIRDFEDACACEGGTGEALREVFNTDL